jgi:hypothetical protein
MAGNLIYFYPEELWFCQVQATFSLSNITIVSTMHSYLAAADQGSLETMPEPSALEEAIPERIFSPAVRAAVHTEVPSHLLSMIRSSLPEEELKKEPLRWHFLSKLPETILGRTRPR